MEIIRDVEGIQRLIELLADAPFVALDTETTGLDPNVDRLLLIQVGTANRQGVIDAEAMTPALLGEIFRADRLVVLHNASFDLKMLVGRFGVWPGLWEAKVADTLLAELLLRNGRSSEIAMNGYGLKVLAARYAGMELDKSIRQGFCVIESIDALSDAELHYAARDVEATWKVFSEQLALLEREHLLRALAIEGAAAIAFAVMELRGAPIDAAGWQVLLDGEAKESREARSVLDREFWSVAHPDLFGGTTLNYDSDEEVLEALGKLGVSLTSTKLEALRATGHPAACALATYRDHQRTVATYGASFLAHVHAKTGRLHPRFTSLGAISGRASCKEPNLQSIPATSAFRACFRAPPGRRIITADYSAAELRVIAELSQDPVFLKTLRDGLDLHAIVARKLFGRSVSKTENPELRARAKAINFGLAYGMGAQGLANQLGVPLGEAEKLLEDYFRAFPRIRDYLNRTARDALRAGRTETLSGRRFWFIDARRDGKDEATLLRIAKNVPIQGSSADITKLAMARATAVFHREGLDAFMVNMVHDELVVEAAEGVADRAKKILVREMVDAGRAFLPSVPVEVDSVVRETWSK
ncbi:MAG: hypothetical protein H6729_07355 [Deltaproteobacteria bacterium]|nr:hypothetical protein [Deltaproteobacteria bacterium]